MLDNWLNSISTQQWDRGVRLIEWAAVLFLISVTLVICYACVIAMALEYSIYG